MVSMLKWCGWFFFGNAILFWLIGLNYAPQFLVVSSSYFTANIWAQVISFSVFSYIGQLALLAYLPSLIVIPLIFLVPNRRIIFLIAAVLATIAAFAFYFDSMMYQLFHFHLNSLFVDLALHGRFVETFGVTTREIVFCLSVIAVIFTAEIIYAFVLWRYLLPKSIFNGWGKWAAIFVIGSLYVSYSLILYSQNMGRCHLLLGEVRFLPLYEDMVGALLAQHDGRRIVQRLQDGYFAQPPEASAPLHYPKQALVFQNAPPALNIVVIMIDAWRFDMLNSTVTPHINAFAKNAWQFTQHYSGGNGTRAGVFAFFYGLPSSYWTAMQTQHRGALILDELQKRHYHVGIFASASLHGVDLDQTVFSTTALPNETQGADPYVRDQMITQQFKEFLQTSASQQPFFSFLFYDAAHSHCLADPPKKLFMPSAVACDRYDLTNQTDPTPYLNRYKNALWQVDNEVGQVLASLQAHHLLEKTVIIITGDHGEEFNDNHLNFWGHSSNFTRYQVQTPLVIYWPGQKPKVYTHLTSHYDIVPTLMKNMLGCNSSPSQFSIGQSLFDMSPRPYLQIGSYTAMGIVEKNQITTIYPTGNYAVFQLSGIEKINEPLNIPLVESVLKTERAFYF